MHVGYLTFFSRMKVNGELLVEDIRRALSSDSTFFFTDLLENCNVLLNTEYEPYLKLLSIFSAGKYLNFAENAGNLPELNEVELTKLRILTILRMSSNKRVLKYSDMLVETGLSSSRDLEQVIIQSIQHNVLDCKIDEANEQVFVNQISGYNVTAEQQDYLLDSLAKWSESCRTITESMQADVNNATCKLKTNVKETVEFQKAVEAAKASVKKEKPHREASSAKSRKRLA